MHVSTISIRFPPFYRVIKKRKKMILFTMRIPCLRYISKVSQLSRLLFVPHSPSPSQSAPSAMLTLSHGGRLAIRVPSDVPSALVGHSALTISVRQRPQLVPASHRALPACGHTKKPYRPYDTNPKSINCAGVYTSHPTMPDLLLLEVRPY